MHYIMGRHKVDDVEAWKRTIEADRQQHLSMGLHFEEVWSNVDDPRESSSSSRSTISNGHGRG